MGSIISIALGLVPSLAGLASGPLGKVLGTVVEGAAHKIFGTTDPEVIKAQIAADATKAEAFKAEIEAKTEQLRIVAQDMADAREKQVADIAGAREQMADLLEKKSPIAWAPVIVSIIIVFFFFGTTTLLFFIQTDLPDRAFQLLYLAFGAEIPMCGQVVNYWLGSSFGSAQKDVTISRNSIAAAQATPPSVIRQVTDMARTAIEKVSNGSGNGGGGNPTVMKRGDSM